MSLEGTLQLYTYPTNNSARLVKAKEDLQIIKVYLDENLRSPTKKNQDLSNASVVASRYLDVARRVADANFELIVKLEESGLMVEELASNPKVLKLTGLSAQMSDHSHHWTIFMQRLTSKIRSCLSKFVKNDPEFLGRLSLRNVKGHCQILVTELPNPECESVMCIGKKRKDLPAPWFTINVRPVLSRGQTSYMMTSAPGGQAMGSGPVWIEFREDLVNPQTEQVQILLRALLHANPFVSQHSAYDIAASAVALYSSKAQRQQYTVRWADLEDRLLCCLDELEKAFRRRDLPHHACPTVNLLQNVSKPAANRMARFLTELMLDNCRQVGIILSHILQHVHREG